MITAYAVTLTPMLDAASRLRSPWLHVAVARFDGCVVNQRSMNAAVGLQGEGWGRFRS